jgi:hypothetical protein
MRWLSSRKITDNHRVVLVRFFYLKAQIQHHPSFSKAISIIRDNKRQ